MEKMIMMMQSGPPIAHMLVQEPKHTDSATSRVSPWLCHLWQYTFIKSHALGTRHLVQLVANTADFHEDTSREDLRRGVEAHVVLDNLEHLLWGWNPTGLQLWPNRHVVEWHFKRSGRDELSFNCITQKEQHHGSVDFISQTPGISWWGLHSDPWERILTTDDENDENDFGCTDDVNEDLIGGWGWIMISFYLQIWIFLLNGVCKLLKDFLVPSGVAKHKTKRRPSEFGQLRGRNVF